MTAPLTNIPPKRIEAISKSPEFMPEFNKQCRALTCEGLDIPDELLSWLSMAIIKGNKAFTYYSDKYAITPEQYASLCSLKADTPMLVKLACCIIADASPTDIMYPTEGNIYVAHSEIIGELYALIDAINMKFQEIQVQTIQALYNRELLSGKI